jgi:hypothetical protein
VYISALAINEFFQKVIERYVRKDGLLGYFVYALMAIAAVLVAVYVGCKWDDSMIDYINVSPLS